MKRILFMLFSFILGTFLMITPLSFSDHWLKPEFMSLILIFWMVFEPQWVGIGVAFFVGLWMDSLKGGLLGQTALAMTIMGYLTQLLSARIRLQPFWHQTLCMLVLIGLSQLILLTIPWVLGVPPATRLVWLSTLTSLLVWPLVFKALSAYKTHY